MRAALTVLVFLAACAPPETQTGPEPAETFPDAIAVIPTRDNPRCGITRIVDGDTVEITCSNASDTVRLTGFDTPETYRSGCPAERRLGQRAAAVLEQNLRRARVIAPRAEGRGKYGRVLVALTLDGTPLAQIMVAEGVAVPYRGGRRIDWCTRLASAG